MVVRKSEAAYDFEAEMSFRQVIGPEQPRIQRVNGSGEKDVTNAVFLRELFRGKGDKERIWVNFLRGDPKTVTPARWSGKPATARDMHLYSTREQALNPFYAVSTFAGDPPKRRIANFVKTYVIALDDIGIGASAKIGPDKVKLPPTFVIETSPDNFQVGYALSEPIAQRNIADVLQDALIHQGLGAERDPGQKNVTRYMRLPCGVNAKSKYVELTGVPFEHQFWLWEPETRYRYQDIVDAYGLTLERVRPRNDTFHGTSLEAYDDPYVRKLDELGLVLGPPIDKGGGETWIPIRCPNYELHTDQDTTGSAYKVGGAFKCHHGTCEHVGFNELQSSLALLYDVTDDELREMNAELRRHRQLRDENLDGYSKAFLSAIKRRKFIV